jgi:phosphoribosyl-AMP cyclohydrolase
MKTRYLVAATISLAMATLSSVSFANDFQHNADFKAEHRGFAENQRGFADKQRDVKPDFIRGGIQVVPSVDSVKVVEPQERNFREPRTDKKVQIIVEGSQPAMRVKHREGNHYYQSRFEKLWGKSWHSQNRTKVIEVQPGDTLTKIANRYRTSVSNLMRLNRMSAYESNHIEIGQLIRIA